METAVLMMWVDEGRAEAFASRSGTEVYFILVAQTNLAGSVIHM
jgi:hypothetical protein